MIKADSRNKLHLIGYVLGVEDDASLVEWQAVREDYDELLALLFAPSAAEGGARPCAELVREAERLRALDEAARYRYYDSRGLEPS